MAHKKDKGFTGRKHTEETKERMRLVHLGNQCALGLKHTVESKAKMSLARVGNKHLLGHVHSSETRAKMSASGKRRRRTAEWRANMSGSNNYFWGKTFDHGQRGKRVVYAGITFRSSYEARFAKALDAHKLKWKYEPKRFDLGTCTYLPDFFVQQTKAYWEVKGWFDPKSKIKIERFRKIHPDIPLIVATDKVIKLMEEV